MGRLSTTPWGRWRQRTEHTAPAAGHPHSRSSLTVLSALSHCCVGDKGNSAQEEVWGQEPLSPAAGGTHVHFSLVNDVEVVTFVPCRRKKTGVSAKTQELGSGGVSLSLSLFLIFKL